MTSVRCNGERVTFGIAVDATNWMVLSIDELPGEDAKQLQAWLEPILDAVDEYVIVGDDADAFKQVSNETGRSQQVCKGHVGRNTFSFTNSGTVTETPSPLRPRVQISR